MMLWQYTFDDYLVFLSMLELLVPYVLYLLKAT